MRTFKDSTGRTWEVSVNVQTIKQVRALVEVDLMDLLGKELLERLSTDTVLLCDVLYALCKREADERGVTDADFGRAMYGDAIADATRALLEDCADFSQDPRHRAALRRVLDSARTVKEKALDAMERRLDRELGPAMERALQKLGASSGSSPESQASIPTP